MSDEGLLANEVRDAALAAKRTRMSAPACKTCGSPRAFMRIEDVLFFDPSCRCYTFTVPMQAASWTDAVKWITSVKGDARKARELEFGVGVEVAA